MNILNKEFKNSIKQTIGDQDMTKVEKINATVMDESAIYRDFFRDNNVIIKNKTNHTQQDR